MNRVVNTSNRDELNNSICELFHRLFTDADHRLMNALERPEDFRLSIPSFLITHVQHAFMMHYHIVIGPSVKWYLRGVEIIPSMDLAITLYHKDYVLYKEEWMIRKVPLASPRKFQNEWYTEYVVALHESFSYFKDDNVESN